MTEYDMMKRKAPPYLHASRSTDALSQPPPHAAAAAAAADVDAAPSPRGTSFRHSSRRATDTEDEELVHIFEKCNSSEIAEAQPRIWMMSVAPRDGTAARHMSSQAKWPIRARRKQRAQTPPATVFFFAAPYTLFRGGVFAHHATP
jgi:hypothetical protein